jgi:PAS domain S-box-containing protein
LAPPPFADPWTLANARILHWVALSFLGGALLWLPVTLSPERGVGFPVALALLLPWIVALAAVRKGYLTPAAWLLIAGLMTAVTVGAVWSGGLRSPAILGYPVLILSAGLLRNVKAAAATTAFSLVSVAALLFLERAGVALPGGVAPDSPTASAMVASYLVAACLVVAGVIHKFSTGKQISDRYRAQLEERNRELELARERYREITDLTSEYFYSLVRRPDGRFETEFITDGFRRITGYDMSEFDAVDWWRMMHPDDLARLRERERLEPGEREPLTEHRIITANGDVRWLRNHSRVVVSDDGAWRRYGASQDITAEHEHAQEIARLEGELRQSQKMEAIGRLAGGVAHDFNNLLTVITGFGDMLLEHTEADKEAHFAAEQMMEASQRAAELTGQLLAFSRRSVHREEIFDLNEVIRRLEPMLARLIGETVRIELDVLHQPMLVSGDPGLLEQVIVNLAVNARDAMGSGGTLRIRTRIAELGADHHELAAGDYVVLSIADDGCGMDADTRAKVFEPFFTTKERGCGTGLGLSTVYGIVRQCAGSIALDSEPGRGTTVAIHLPLATAGVPDATPSCVPGASGGSRGASTILVVDDDERVRTLMHRLLERAGHRVFVSGSGPEALALAASYDGDLDLVLSDVVMPGMDGTELMAALRRTRPEVRFLLMSGYANTPGDGRRELPSDAGFLQKPFGPEALAAKIAEMLAQPAAPPA